MTPWQRLRTAQPLTAVQLTAGQRARQLANLANGTTVLGLAVARAAGTAVSRGPRGLIIAAGYFPYAGLVELVTDLRDSDPVDHVRKNAQLLLDGLSEGK